MVPERSLIDVHCHLVVTGPSHRGFVSEKMLRSFMGRMVRRRFGVKHGDHEALGRAYFDRLRSHSLGSRFLRGVVLLALDGVYDAAGKLDVDATHLFVSNDAVLELANEEERFLAGASINPVRLDAIDELARVDEAGAVLVKWLPNSQLFDPADARFKPFYRELARRKMPLLIHSGVEYSVVSAAAQSFGEPMRWRQALDEGVTVIAAHGGSSGRFLGRERAERFLALVEKYPNLYADSSALTVPNRVRMLPKLLAHDVARSRLTFGTDFPVPAFPSQLLLRLDPASYLRVLGEKNYFDQQVLLLEALGWRPSSTVFDRLMASRL